MTKAILVHETGGPEVLSWDDHETPPPGPGEVTIDHKAVGLNFLDVYFRTGLYPAPAGMPFVPGNEGAGVVAALGEGVTGLKEGDRVAYAGPMGAYAETRNIAADRLVKVPDGISDEQAAAIMLAGMTVWYLLRRTFKVGKDNTILVHAAAGGVGLIAGQWARHIGATVIGTAGSAEKIELAKANGYDHVINYRTEDFVERVREITGGDLCDVVYDSVGKDTFPGSLDCIRPLGMWVSFGQSSGALPPVNLAVLSQKGSLFATRPTLFTYIAKRSELEAAAGELFDLVGSGVIKVRIGQTFPLSQAADAHRALEARQTTGATVLLP